jgi:glutathione S-transferase
MNSVVLFGEPRFISPYVYSCFVTLTEKNVPFEMATLDATTGDTRRPLYVERTVTGRVPSLSHGDFNLAESSAIVEYLDEAFPEPRVLPVNLEARARCRQFMSWLRSDDTAKIREERPSSVIFYSPPIAPLSEDGVRAVQKLVNVTERLLGGRRQLFDTWCIADAELAFMLKRLIAANEIVPDFVRAYADAQWSRPSVQTFVTHSRLPSL